MKTSWGYVSEIATRRPSARRATASAAFCTLALIWLFGSLASSARALGPAISMTKSATEPYYACPHEACLAIVDPTATKTSKGWELPEGGPLLEGTGERGGYDPQDLRSAYKLAATGGSGQTIAVIDAYGDPTAESDLKAYRAKYGLSECTKANKCLKIVNAKGEETGLPEAKSSGWELETSLDVDMASAICQECHILLVETTQEVEPYTGEAVNLAARLGATEISNSYGYPEKYEPWCGTTGCSQYATNYDDHTGVPVLASSGDIRLSRRGERCIVSRGRAWGHRGGWHGSQKGVQLPRMDRESLARQRERM